MPPTIGKGAVSIAFVRPSVCQSVAYIGNNSRTQRPSVHKFGMKVPHLRCDSHTSFKVKQSELQTGGGIPPYWPNLAATLLVIIMTNLQINIITNIDDQIQHTAGIACRGKV